MITGTTTDNSIRVNADYSHVMGEEYKGVNPEDYAIITSADYIPNEIELDSFHYHEMLDRLYVVTSTINDQLLQHPVTFNHKRLYNKIEKALKLLGEAYQMTGYLESKTDTPIYTQKQVNKMLSKAGVITGNDAKIFFDNIANPKALSPEIKERMLNNFNFFQSKFIDK